jgi:hypothetical protein
VEVSSRRSVRRGRRKTIIKILSAVLEILILLFNPSPNGVCAVYVVVLSGEGLWGDAMFVGSVRMGTMLK